MQFGCMITAADVCTLMRESTHTLSGCYMALDLAVYQWMKEHAILLNGLMLNR